MQVGTEKFNYAIAMTYIRFMQNFSLKTYEQKLIYILDASDGTRFKCTINGVNIESSKYSSS